MVAVNGAVRRTFLLWRSDETSYPPPQGEYEHAHRAFAGRRSRELSCPAAAGYSRCGCWHAISVGAGLSLSSLSSGGMNVFTDERRLARTQGDPGSRPPSRSARSVMAGVLAGGVVLALVAGAIYMSIPKYQLAPHRTALNRPPVIEGQDKNGGERGRRRPQSANTLGSVSAPADFDTSLNADPDSADASSGLYGHAQYTVAGGTYAYADQAGGKQKQAPVLQRAEAQRKIKHTAEVSVIVDNFDPIADRVAQLAQSYHGYVAQSEINGSPGSPRSGRWRVRIPVDEFQPFLSAAQKLGVPERNTTDSQDVTADYVDLDARLKNKKEQEQTLRGYLKETKPKAELKDILAVEQELSRVRGEVEQLEGELRLLTNLTSLTTVTLSVKEIKNYVAPEAPSFATNATRTFSGSKDTLIEAAKTCALAAVAAVPWIPVGLLAMVVLWIMIRVARNALAGGPTTSPPPAEGTAST